MLEKQIQSAAPGAIAVQTHGDVHLVHGISFADARQVALDVYQANFPTLVAEAAQLARARAEELTDKFLKQLHAEFPEGLAQAKQPDFQNALLNAQKEHACAGDERLADLLVDLLVDRAKQPPRALRQLVLDEALKTAPKLTDDQVAVLALVFLLRYVLYNKLDFAGFTQYLKGFVVPVLLKAQVTQSTLAHLQFSGCGSPQPFSHGDLIAHISTTYAGLFQKGFGEVDLTNANLPQAALKFIVPLSTNENLKQVGLLNETAVRNAAEVEKLDSDSTQRLVDLLNGHKESPEAVQHMLVRHVPQLATAFGLWNDGNIGTFQLTSVGQALGHAYVKKTLGHEVAPLEIWIK